MQSKISHFEWNVSDYPRSVRFYDTVLLPLGWKKINHCRTHTAYTDGHLKLIICPTEAKHRAAGFHRKRTGLNHIALAASSKAEVDDFALRLKANEIPLLYEGEPTGDDGYYAVFFEDPDRVKLELVYAPHYCEDGHWPNTLPNDYDL